MARRKQRGRDVVDVASDQRALPLLHESVRQELEGRAYLSRFPSLARPLDPVHLRPHERPRTRGLWSTRSRVVVKWRGPVGLARRTVPALHWRVPVGLSVRSPLRVLFCVRRKARREVLFAYSKAGFGGSSPGRRDRSGRKYRRSASSAFSC